MIAYGRWPSVHCGPQNSASVGHSGRTSSSLHRERFHQFVRSETKISFSPSHRGCTADSLGPPATDWLLTAVAPLKEPTMILVESHGMFGWFHWVQANRPLAESSGVE